MKERDNKRREVLKLIGAGSVGSIGFQLPVAAEQSGTPSSEKPVSYGIRMRNAGTNPVNVVVQVTNIDDSHVTVVREESGELTQGDANDINKSLIKGGEHTFQAKAIFKEQEPVTAEENITIPPGGFPDYMGVLINIYSDSREVRISTNEV